MFPGFVTIYKDKDKFIHLYFFPGINESNEHIYRNLDLSNSTFKYDEVKNSDDSIDYKFDNKNIKKIYCKLIMYNADDYVYETLSV